MFKFARRHSKSLWVKVMYSLIAFSFLIGFAVFIGSGITSYVRTGGLAPNIVAEVNGKQITLTEFERTLRNLKQEIDNPYIKELFLTQLINRIILTDIAKNYGFSVSDHELAEYIASLKYFSDSNGNFNKNIYYTILKQNNISPADFEQSTRDELLLINFKDFISTMIEPDDEDLWWYFKKKNEKATFFVSKIEPERIEKGITLKEKEIKDYYDANKNQLKGDVRKTIEYLLFPFSRYEEQSVIEENEIAGYYKEMRKSFVDYSGTERRLKGLQEVRAEIERKLKSRKAEELARIDAEKSRELLLSGETFDSVAEKYGIEKRIAGPAEEEEMKKINDAGKALSEIFTALDEGKVSEVKRTNAGFVIGRIIKVDPPVPLTFEEARGKIIETLRKEKAKQVVKMEAERLQREIGMSRDPKRFLEFRGYKVEETDEVTIDKSFVKGIGFAPGFFRVSEKLNHKNRFPEEPYEFLGNYYVYWLKERRSAERSVFDSEKDNLRREYIEEEVNNKLQELIQEARKTAEIKINKEIFAENAEKGRTRGIPLDTLF